MAPHEIRRPHKRPMISDQQKRRELSLQRQQQNRLDAQQRARSLASTLLSFSSSSHDPSTSEPVLEIELDYLDSETERSKELLFDYELSQPVLEDLDVQQASKLKGSEARKWFARQLLLPEWMIDVPDRLSEDWYVFARPAGKRCFVVSSNGTTVSRLRNGSILHRFPSALPNGARTRDVSGSSQSYSILDCIFHEMDQTYYVIDMVCWRGYSLYDCTAEFRFFWLSSKLVETGACEPPSHYHKYKFSPVPVYPCDQNGLYVAYTGAVPYVKDGLLFYYKHSHYQSGNTPLALVWKDENCSQYVIDTDSNGQVPSHQQVVLELQDDGKITTSDDPPVEFGCLDADFIQKVLHTDVNYKLSVYQQTRAVDVVFVFSPIRGSMLGLRSGNLLRFTIAGLTITDGRIAGANLHYLGKVNRARAFADSYSKIMFQYAVRHSPLKIDDLLASINSSKGEDRTRDAEMVE